MSSLRLAFFKCHSTEINFVVLDKNFVLPARDHLDELAIHFVCHGAILHLDFCVDGRQAILREPALIRAGSAWGTVST